MSDNCCYKDLFVIWKKKHSERVNLKEIWKLSVENQKGAIAIDCVQLSSTLMVLKITLLNSDNTLLSLN